MRAILLIDHGSRSPTANENLERVARLVQAKAGDAVLVQHAHMELAKPDIEMGVAACVAAGATEILAHPYMLAPGRHATQDIPRLVKLAVEGHPNVRFRVTPPLGVHPGIAAAVLDRCGFSGGGS